MSLDFSNEITVNGVPEELKPWIFANTSLTKKLRELMVRVEVNVLSQGWFECSWWEKYALMLDGMVFVRQITMMGNGGPCWYARSVIPDECYRCNRDFFEQLTTKSLGQILYSHPEVVRTDLNYYAVTVNAIEYYWTADALEGMLQEPLLWVRRTRYVLRGQAFFLFEVFLPEFIRCLPGK